MKTLRTRLASTAACLVFVWISPPSANAEPSAADKTVATQLFKEGRLLLDQGRVAEACFKLEESQKIEPGGGTLLNVALCHERQGRTAAAWVEFTEALGIARRDENAARVEFARAHLAQVEPLLSRLTVQVAPAADLPDLEVKCDGSILARAAWGSPVPVDPGEHLIEASAPGKVQWKQSLLVGPNADSKTAVVPVLQTSPIQDTPPAPPPSAPSASAGHAPPATDAGRSSRVSVAAPEQAARRSQASSAPAWVALGLGVAAAGAGTYLGIRALSERNDANRGCPNDICSAEGESENNQAIRFANYATAGVAVGAAGIGLGTILFFVYAGPSHAALDAKTESVPKVTPWFQLSGAGLSERPGGAEFEISGRW
ncbi:MAG: hypothetical protein ABSC94_25835 [Polyangiaceae bacterium]|jgi:hypothetical protein